jgi:hypothetical protein
LDGFLLVREQSFQIGVADHNPEGITDLTDLPAVCSHIIQDLALEFRIA